MSGRELEVRVSATTRVGIIGCGRAGERLHAPALARIGGARLAAVADPRRDRAELLARGVADCRIYGSGEELLESGYVDAVIVANPPGAHLVTAVNALVRDISALVEKPLSTSLEGLDRLESVACESAAVLMMGYNRRFWEPARRLRGLLSEWSGSDARARMRFTTDQKSWGALEGTEDALENLAPHQLDLARFVFDREIESVIARWVGPGAIEINISLAGDITVELEAGHAARYEEWARVELDGRSYRIWSGSERVAPADGLARVGLDVGDALARRARRRPAPLRRSYEEQLRAFIAGVRGERAPDPGLADGLAVVRAIDAARRSAAADGEEVRI